VRRGCAAVALVLTRRVSRVSVPVVLRAVSRRRSERSLGAIACLICLLRLGGDQGEPILFSKILNHRLYGSLWNLRYGVPLLERLGVLGKVVSSGFSFKKQCYGKFMVR